jgi:hypothetical protein
MASEAWQPTTTIPAPELPPITIPEPESTTLTPSRRFNVRAILATAGVIVLMGIAAWTTPVLLVATGSGLAAAWMYAGFPMRRTK